MPSKVYFISLNENDPPESANEKLKYLLEQSALFDFVPAGVCAVVKMHFGEDGNTGFVKPHFLKIIIQALKEKGAQPFLSDTNTLYSGRRTNCADHLALAYEHGFTQTATGAKVIIPDDRDKDCAKSVKIDGKIFKQVSLAGIYLDTSVFIGVAHFKGHIVTGFGGALKNIGMGSATRKGKLAQHSELAPVVIWENCTGCAACSKICPAQAINIVNKKSVIDQAKCIGCASCIAVCKFRALDVNWGSGADLLQEKMIEHAAGVLKDKKGKSVFINFATKITKECDCIAKDDARICPDIGIFASTDPVSVDQACLDAVIKKCGRDIFKQLHPQRDGLKQLKHAVDLNLGSRDYELINYEK
ncbi:MAG: DUF362 domain-containing protein [Candidatus Omnitrophica bacterium]|nr:DUF362 domain-containing protein [Candidatus Omnitrophota bacterium]